MVKEVQKNMLETIARKLKDGNEKAFDQLFEATRDYLFYFIYGIVKDQTLADDILQDTYMTVYLKIDTYTSKNFMSWIMTIAKNKAINAINRNKRAVYVDDVESAYLFKDISDDDELMLLKDMSTVLDEEEFQIVLMHVIGNYTHKQIALGLEKPIGTITWKYAEAMKKLRSKLEV